MAMYYSAMLGGFLDDAIHATLPPDAVAIAADHHARLLAAQSAGKRIVPGPGGRPAAKPRAAIPFDAVRAAAIAQVKREAARRIAAAAPLWRQLNALRSPAGAAAPLFVTVDAVRAASDRIEAAIAVMGAAEIAALDISREFDDAD